MNKISTALISVWDKSSLDILAKKLIEVGIEIISSGGTAKFLRKKGIETRIIISGNFVNQPSVKIYNLNPKNESFPKAQEIENRGFFIGLHSKSISEETLNHLEKNLLKISEL